MESGNSSAGRDNAFDLVFNVLFYSCVDILFNRDLIILRKRGKEKRRRDR
jgi:hypothetical protein